MEETKKPPEDSGESSSLYYGIGAAILILLVAGFYIMKSKNQPTSASPQVQSGPTGVAITRPTGPIKGLACEIQWYNPVVAFNKYFLSVGGTDLAPAETVGCDFSISQGQKVVATDKVSKVALTDEASRSGKVFNCTTKELELKPNVSTVVDVNLKDDQGKTATCSATFLLPKGQ